jgi:hypothetical protein
MKLNDWEIEDVRLRFSWCVCATCIPAYPWANRAVPRSYSDGAPTSCRVFLVRTLERVQISQRNQTTNQLIWEQNASQLICRFPSGVPFQVSSLAHFYMKCPPAQRKIMIFLFGLPPPYPPLPPPKTGKMSRFAGGPEGVDKNMKYTPYF